MRQVAGEAWALSLGTSREKLQPQLREGLAGALPASASPLHLPPCLESKSHQLAAGGFNKAVREVPVDVSARSP